MKKLRIFWAVIVVLVTAVFTAYRINEIRKEDSSGPVFSCEETELKVSIYDGDEVLLEGITASDKKDGDVTDSILVEKISNFYGDGNRLVTYAAFDSDDHISEFEREITYTDYQRPHFEINGSLRFRAGETVNIDKIVKATDCLDGDISNKIRIMMDSSINNRITGAYQIEYQVSNSAGDSVSLPIEIEIYEAYRNEVEMSLDTYLVYYDGTAIDYKDYLKSIKIGNLEYPFEGVMLEGMEGMDIQMPATVEEESQEEDVQEAEEDSEEPQQQDAEEEDAQETVSEPVEEENSNTITFIPKSRVTVRSSVDTSKPGVYPVYFYYLDPQEHFNYEAAEVMYVVVE